MQCLSLQSIFYLGIFLAKYTMSTESMISDPQPSMNCVHALEDYHSAM